MSESCSPYLEVGLGLPCLEHFCNIAFMSSCSLFAMPPLVFLIFSPRPHMCLLSWRRLLWGEERERVHASESPTPHNSPCSCQFMGHKVEKHKSVCFMEVTCSPRQPTWRRQLESKVAPLSLSTSL